MTEGEAPPIDPAFTEADADAPGADTSFEEPDTSGSDSDTEESAEDAAEKEGVSRERQIDEVTFLGSSLAFNEIMKVDTNEEYTDNPAKRALRLSKAFLEFPEGDYSSIAEAERTLGGEHPVLVSIDDIQYEVLRIDSGTEAEFTCSMKNVLTGETEDKPISRNRLAVAQIISERDTIKTLYSPENHQVLDVYFDLMEKGNESFTPDESTDELIKSTAERNGVVTSDKVKEFIDSSSLSDEKKAALGKLLEGTNILDYAVLEKMMGESDLEGNFESKLGEMKEKFQGSEQAEKIFQAMKEGNMHDVILMIQQDLVINPNDSPEEIARKKEALEKSSSLLKDGGTIMLYLLFYLGLSTIEASMQR